MLDKVPNHNRFVTARMLLHHPGFRLILIVTIQSLLSIIAGLMIDFPVGCVVAVISSFMSWWLMGQVRFYVPEDAAVYWIDYYKRKVNDRDE